MFFNRRRFLAAAALFLCACGRRQPQEIQRLAITRFENLAPDPATDWIGRALAEVVTAELTGSASLYAMPSSRLHSLNAAFGPRPIQAPGVSAEAPLARAAGANRIGYGEYAIVGGRLRVRLTVEEPQTRTVAAGPIEVNVDAGDVIGAATAIARRLSTDAKPYATSTPAALEVYVRGLEAGDPASIRRCAEQAVAADPNYGPGYVLLAESALQQQDRAAAAATIQAAAARGSAISQTSRARLEILSATLRGDGAAVENGVTELTRLTPLDPGVWRSLGDTAAARRGYAQAVAAYHRALAIEPQDVAVWNQVGYVAAYAGSFETALDALRRYQALRPAEPNPVDSLGDVYLMMGSLKEAEASYLEAYKKNPAFLNGLDLFKAAMARLMTGDVAGADRILGDRAANPEWQWLSGRRAEAIAALTAEAAKQSQPDIRARQYALLAVWTALRSDRDAAARFAAQAAAVAAPASAGTVAISRFVTMPSAPASEWAVRAERLFANAPQNPLKDLAIACALLLDRRFADAIPFLRNLEARSGPNGDRSAALNLAWAMIETGKVQEAAPLLRLNPVPGADSATAFLGLYFPRLFQLRAIVAEREGKADEARENRRIYSALGGK